VITYIKPSLLGDTILIEPAMTAWSIVHGQAVKLCLDPENKAYECLFHHNPHIEVIPYQDKNTREEEVIVPDASAAFWDANGKNLPFAGGYFPQFGLKADPAKDRLYYKVFGLPKRQTYKGIVICPNARSCTSAVDRNHPPNIMATHEWWGPIVNVIRSMGYGILDLGSDDDVAVPGVIPYHGHDFREVVETLNQADLAISVETGLLHLAGGIEGLPIIFLSSATPPFFSAPKGARVVRAKTPGRTDFDQNEVIGHIEDILST
jgi:hypothetical protein